jgi:putative endonuclease
MNIYVVYILTNKPYGTLYIGVTGNLQHRMYQHKHELFKGFSKKYALKRLVYFERFGRAYDAISREKQLKRWHRRWKINLIEGQNPDWDDLCVKIFGIDSELNKIGS